MSINNKIRLILIIGFTVFSVGASAQTSAKEIYTREVFLNFPDSVLRLNILVKSKKIKIQSERIYYWYGSEKLASNRGGYSGNVLHGKYTQFDKKNRLRVEGFFNFGLKDGLWRLWNEDGEILSVISWKNGLKEGEAYFYDRQGKLQKTLYYKDDIITKATVLYRGEVKKVKYKNGIEVKQEQKSKEKRKKRAERAPRSDEDKVLPDKTTDKKSNGVLRLFQKQETENKAKPAKENKEKSKKTNHGIFRKSKAESKAISD